MTGRAAQPQSKAVLRSATPQLFVTDLRAACEYFTARLGFVIDFIYGAPPFYGQVVRDSAQLALRQIDRPAMAAITTALQAEADMLVASIVVDDVERLFQEFTAAGAVIYQALRMELWGARTFIVCDLDGNLLLFTSN